MSEKPLNDNSRLTSNRLLARNTILNLIGQGAPMLVALFTIPLIIKGLGKERFGVLTLLWMVVGYFGLLDLGLSRALTQFVAEKLGRGDEETIPETVWTALLVMGTIGLVGTIGVCLLSPWLVHGILKIPRSLQGESLKAFYVLTLSIPIVMGSASLMGILQANQRFGLLNTVHIPMGIFTYAGPLLALLFSKSIFAVVAVLTAGRIIACFTYLMLCFHIMPGLRHNIRLQFSELKKLISFGSWLTVTNIVNPLMAYMDRFLIGSLLSMTAVTYYSIPYEMVIKLRIIQVSLVTVLFPAFTTSFVQSQTKTALLFRRGTKYLFLTLFPIVLLIVTLAHEGLLLWLGAEFAQKSTFVLQCLAIGVFINGIAFLPFALIQGIGRPDITAKFHLIELPFYLLAIWGLIRYGIEGVAIAWVLRVTIDMVFLYSMSWRLLAINKPIIQRMVCAMGIALLILTLPVILPMGLAIKGIFLLLMVFTYLLVAWFLILELREKALVQDQLKKGWYLLVDGKRKEGISSL